MPLADQIIQAESGGNPNAQNPSSSAGGLGQIIDSTWLSLIRQYKPDLAAGKSQSDILALKTDPALNREMTGAYASQNAQALTNAGLSASPGNVYLAHFAGPQGAVNILKAAPDAQVSDVLGPSVIQANPFLKGMTVSGLQHWASGKMGKTGAPMSVTPPAAASSSPPSFDGMLNNNSNAFTKLAQQLGPGGGLLNAGQNQPPPQLPPMQTATPAAQALKQQILASFLKGQTA